MVYELSHSSPCIGPNDRVYVGSRYRDYGYLHAFGPGVPKKIEVLEPIQGHLYFFNHNLGRTLRNKTIVIGSVTIKVKVYSPEDLIKVSFSTDYFLVSVTSPPYEWTMNQSYGTKLLLKDTIAAVAYYKGGCSWTEAIPMVYFHLF